MSEKCKKQPAGKSLSILGENVGSGSELDKFAQKNFPGFRKAVMRGNEIRKAQAENNETHKVNFILNSIIDDCTVSVIPGRKIWQSRRVSDPKPWSSENTGPIAVVQKRVNRMAKNGDLPYLGNNLIEEIASQANIEKAWEHELRKNGQFLAALGYNCKLGRGKAPGIDGKKVNDAYREYQRDPASLSKLLLTGNYQPSPVKRKIIPKPNGGERLLGIPNAIDRVVQQAIRQVLEPELDQFFSDSSFGFRRRRSVHGAVAKVLADINMSKVIKFIVAIDLSKYFDTVNHACLMAILEAITGDEPLLDLIYRFLKAGVSIDGKIERTEAGVPQGGVFSPLLSNLYLHLLDMLLERLGHPFCRYADDFIILAKSRRAANRISREIAEFLTAIGLTVNRDKSKVIPVSECTFLGLDIRDGEIRISEKDINAFKDQVRGYVQHDSVRRTEKSMGKLGTFLSGWFAHYGKIECNAQILAVHEWYVSFVRKRISNDHRETDSSPLCPALGHWLSQIDGNPYWKQTLESCFCDLNALWKEAEGVSRNVPQHHKTLSPPTW
jgi:RNA-directed DNA polymerase